MMQTFELIAPCHFGLESVVKNEIYDLGYEITEVDDGGSLTPQIPPEPSGLYFFEQI